MNEFIWIKKSDPVYKTYIDNNWNRILGVKNELNETYYCFTRDNLERENLPEFLKKVLIVPITIKENNIDNFIITFKQFEKFGFIWQDQRCFSVPLTVIDKIKKSPMSFYKQNEIYEVSDVSHYMNNSSLKIKTTVDLMPLFLIFVCTLLIILTGVGLFIWLF